MLFIVGLQDKKYYPTAEEVFGPEVEVGNLKVYSHCSFPSSSINYSPCGAACSLLPGFSCLLLMLPTSAVFL